MAEKTEVNVVETKEIELEDIKIDGSENVSDFDKALDSLKNKLKNVEINISNIMIVVKFAMEVVEMTKLKGEEQKDLAVKLIKTIVVDAPISDSKEKLILDMIEGGVVDATIDLVVAASRGQLNVNVVGEAATTCCGAICSIIMKKIKK
jgi:hypothetical protein